MFFCDWLGYGVSCKRNNGDWELHLILVCVWLGYVINYKRDHGDWEEMQIEAKANSHTLHNLWCGTRYQLYITAFNKIGTGLPCDIVNAYTKGSGTVNHSYVYCGVYYVSFSTLEAKY
jgi:hypothetical protein